MLLCKRQLGQKTATASSLSAWLIACTEVCVALTDGWGEGWEGWRRGASWCTMRALYSELLIKTNISDPDPPLSNSYQSSLQFRDAAISQFVSNVGFKKFSLGAFYWKKKITECTAEWPVIYSNICIKLLYALSFKFQLPATVKVTVCYSFLIICLILSSWCAGTKITKDAFMI